MGPLVTDLSIFHLARYRLAALLHNSSDHEDQACLFGGGFTEKETEPR